MARKKTVHFNDDKFDSFGWYNTIVNGKVTQANVRYEHLRGEIFKLSKTDKTWSWLVKFFDRSVPNVSTVVNLIKGWNILTLDEAKEIVETVLPVLIKREKYTREN